MPHGGGKGSFGWSNYLSYSVALRAQWMALRKVNLPLKSLRRFLSSRIPFTDREWHQKRVGVQRIDDGVSNFVPAICSIELVASISVGTFSGAKPRLDPSPRFPGAALLLPTYPRKAARLGSMDPPCRSVLILPILLLAVSLSLRAQGSGCRPRRRDGAPPTT